MECFVFHPHEIGLMFQKKHELRAAPRSKKRQNKTKIHILSYESWKSALLESKDKKYWAGIEQWWDLGKEWFK